MKRGWMVLLLAVAELLTFPAARATTPVRLQLSGRFKITVAGEAVKEGKVYRNKEGEARPSFLVTLPIGAYYFVGGDKIAHGLDTGKIGPAADDKEAVDIDSDATVGTPVSVTIDGGKAIFNANPTPFALESADPILADTTVETVVAALPEWRRNIAAYEPSIGDLRLLDTLKTPTEIRVFFGSWCPHCEKHVPRLIRVIQSLKTKNLTLKLYGLPTDFVNEPMARQFKVTALPTGVLFQGGKQIARLEEINWDRPEAGLTAVLFGEAALGQ